MISPRFLSFEFSIAFRRFSTARTIFRINSVFVLGSFIRLWRFFNWSIPVHIIIDVFLIFRLCLFIAIIIIFRLFNVTLIFAGFPIFFCASASAGSIILYLLLRRFFMSFTSKDVFRYYYFFVFLLFCFLFICKLLTYILIV